jgi:transaldolase/glucose-6-phosphate isomerase
MTKRIEMRGPTLELRLGSGPGATAYDDVARRAETERWAERLHDRDVSLWSTDPRVQAAIAERLGWLDAPEHFSLLIPTLEAFAIARRDEGFTAAIVGGMGGSSLAPDVLSRTFGSGDGWLELRVLDSTDPEAVAATADDLDPLATLFIVATKSGTTTEPLAFQADAWHRIEQSIHARRVRAKPGDFMVAVTDPGKSVAGIPHHDELRELFLNPPDIGGRYSALTYVGLVPAALLGLDLDPLLASARTMLAHSRDNDPARNSALALGLAMGALAVNGRDKLTFIPDPEIESLGAWAEQLIAESTGKHGVGIVPVDLEPLGTPDAYGPDRVFVRIALRDSAGVVGPDGRPVDALLADLEMAGHPVIRIDLPHSVDLAGEFVRWEVATAISGIVLGIDPFDQPNVEEAKESTRQLLAARNAPAAEVPQDDLPGAFQGATEPAVTIPSAPPGLAREEPLTLIGDTALQLTHGDGTAVGEMRRHLARLRPSSYIALQAYVAPTATRDEALARIRRLLRNATRHATTLGYGPRFLHSTGQLHKGGPPTGWFLQLTADHPADRAIPGWPYSFGQLIDAQAKGDFQVLEAHELPILRVHLGPDPDLGLSALERLLSAALQDAAAVATADGGRNA